MNFKHKDIVIIGAGIAGLSLAQQLSASLNTKNVALIEQKSLVDLLNNLHPLVLFEPAFMVGGPINLEFNSEVYFKSLDFYQTLGRDVWHSRGLVKLANNQHLIKKEIKLVNLIKSKAAISTEFQYLNSKELSELTDILISQSGIYYPKSGTLNPKIIHQRIIEKTPQIDYQFNQSILRIEKQAAGWGLFTANGNCFLKTKKLIYCAGYQGLNLLKPILPNFVQNLSATRGQISIIEASKCPIQSKIALSGDGFISPVLKPNSYFKTNNICFGSSWDRRFTKPNLVLVKDHQSNLSKANKLTQQNIMNPNLSNTELLKNLKASVGMRVHSKNRLPIMAEIKDDFWLLTALGSRGYQYAPYLASLLVKQMN